jgi:hypothetical protein
MFEYVWNKCFVDQTLGKDDMTINTYQWVRTNYLCNQCLSPLKLWAWSTFIARCIIYYVIKFVSDLRQVDGFLRVLRFFNSQLNQLVKSSRGSRILCILFWYYDVVCLLCQPTKCSREIKNISLKKTKIQCITIILCTCRSLYNHWLWRKNI